MRQISLVLLVAVVLGGCSEPGDSVPRLGRYSYQFAAGALTASGRMVLTYAAEDSIAGRFEVQNYDGRFEWGFFDADAYVVHAYPDTGSVVIHRFRRDGDGGLRCAAAQWIVSWEESHAGTCTVSYHGPES